MNCNRFLLVAALAVGMSLSAGKTSQAAFGDFQYGTTVTPSPISPSTTVGGPGSQVSQAGVGNFAAPTAPTFTAATPTGTAITVGTISVTDLAVGGAYTDTYSSPITVNLAIKDVDSGVTKNFTFLGTLTGTVSSNGTTQSAVFNNPFLATPGQSMVIGTTTYLVSINPTTSFTAPGAPPTGGTGEPGAYSFNVKAVPEPASVVLMGLGGVGMAMMVRRRKSRAQG